MEQKKKLRVLIVDDEAVIRMGLKAMVTGLGYEVAGTATNGDEAITQVKTLRPDLLLLDIKMPGKDGLTVAENLASENPLPIIMLPAFTDQDLIERAANAAVMGYLVKPINESKLGPMIEVALTRFADMRQAAAAVYQLRDQLESRELVEAAKRILVAAGLPEAEAYKRLQMTAREKRRPMREVAEAVIAVGKKLAAQ